MPKIEWKSPKEALAYALEHFPDDALELTVHAYWARGKVHCETNQAVPAIRYARETECQPAE